MTYFVYLNTMGIQEVVFEGTLEECSKYEDNLRAEIRKKDPDRVTMDCYIMSAEEIDNMLTAKERWSKLTDDQKPDTIVLGGRKFVKALVEQNGKLRTLRKANGLSVDDLAQKTGVNVRMIQKYENGEKDINKAAASTVKALAQALRCSIEDLID